MILLISLIVAGFAGAVVGTICIAIGAPIWVLCLISIVIGWNAPWFVGGIIKLYND